ncbi:hypothetical protein GS429_08345 [Natronorubrum sp. JWXQ-INN-674]|uniref:Uncharacterized protein n=1 Tax=Natronorubrum halalkaliphilum TaxID=2691917 RepID=A0A6B0VNC6_9EURY|nr:hypothetical protein [Natronorubrum halalkaliphilum]MXV62069.1 hypothetical protein [Natronorubrum halalkaliphilum]
MSRSHKVGSRREIDSAIERTYRLAEAVAVTPGMLLEVTGVDDDGTPLVAPQRGDGENVSVRIAIEKKTGSDTPREEPKDVDITEPGDEIRAYVLRPGEGDENGLAGDAISEGEPVVSNGDGTFREHVDEDEGAKLAVALEDAQADDRFEYEVI